MDSTQGPSQSTTPTPPSTSTSRVRSAPGVQISPAQIELLVNAFPESQTIFIKREFRSGYSGALVLLVSLGADRAPVVVKLSHPHDLQTEYKAYQQFVRQISPQNIAHLQGEPLISADGQVGLIEYSFAGGESQQPATSLRDYYESNGGDASAAVLNRIFRAFGRYWWANNRPHLYTLGEQYDRLLPVHLQVAKTQIDGEPPDKPLVLLENGKTSVLASRPIEVGQSVRLLGFEVTKVAIDGRKMTLMAHPPPSEASAPLRLRLEIEETEEPLPYKRGDVVDVLDVIVVATRSTLLRDAAVAALPSFDPETKAFTADLGGSPGKVANVSLVNPLYDLSGLLDHVVETKTSVIHGDLNLQNVLVDPPTGFAWIIDFGETRHGPTLLDLQRLEVQVITKLLPSKWRDGQLELADLVELLVSLHTDSLPASPSQPILLEPYRVLVTIRRLARQYLIDDLNWDEYYLGLAIALVGSLKYEELDSQARALALVAAATVQGLVGSRLTIGHSAASVAGATIQAADASKESTPLQAVAASAVVDSKPPPAAAKRGFLGIGGAIIIGLLALFVVWRLWSASSLSSTPEATQTPAATESQSASAATPDAEAEAQSNTQSKTPNAVAAQSPEATAAAEATVAPEATTAPEALPLAASLPTTAAAGDIWVNPVDGVEYLFVPEGEFIMGTDDENSSNDSRPEHLVLLSGYWIMRTEVTNEQYKSCVDAGACTEPANDRWTDSAFAEHPVSEVSWQQAVDYALWSGGRLPTEAEWEKAARGTDGRAYPWGNEITGDTQLNYNSPTGDTVAVGSYPEGASIYGALDMAGNVEEWVADWYADDYYATSPAENPTGPEEGTFQILRGGSYFSRRHEVLTTSRAKVLPDSHFESAGFRVVQAP